MRMLAFSDIHCDHAACLEIAKAGEKADLIIGAGDFAQRREGLADTMAMLEINAHKSIYVPGNNETADELRAATKAIVLHGEVTVFEGLKIAGLGAAVPPLPPLHWGSFDLSEPDAESMLGQLQHADILISHSPAKGVADIHQKRGSIGSEAVRAAVRRLRPAFLFCGHVHDCWGQSGMIETTSAHNLGPRVNWFDL